MANISNNIYSIDGLEILFPGHGVIPYLVEEGHNDLTLIGPSTRLLKKVMVYRGIVVVVLWRMNSKLLQHWYTESIVRLKVLKFSAGAYRVDCHLVIDTDTEEDVECFG